MLLVRIFLIISIDRKKGTIKCQQIIKHFELLNAMNRLFNSFSVDRLLISILMNYFV
jgi:hypothetical protein